MKLLALAALVLLAPLAASEGGRVASRPYVAGPGDARVVCDALGTGQDLGGACFEVLPGEAHATVFVNDVWGGRVGGIVRVRDGLGVDLAEVGFCRSTSFGIPSRATALAIQLDEAFGVYDCGLDVATASAGVAFAGSITVYLW